jgi:hypothetical protein
LAASCRGVLLLLLLLLVVLLLLSCCCACAMPCRLVMRGHGMRPCFVLWMVCCDLGAAHRLCTVRPGWPARDLMLICVRIK